MSNDNDNGDDKGNEATLEASAETIIRSRNLIARTKAQQAETRGRIESTRRIIDEAQLRRDGASGE